MPYWKTGRVVSEEGRKAALYQLYKNGRITVQKYMAELKGEPTEPKTKGAKVMDVVQLGLVAAIVVSVVYGIKMFK